MELGLWKYWIFDMDGTLTIPKHNFVEIRKTLGIPQDSDILSFIDVALPSKKTYLNQKLEEIEREIALQAEVSPDALELLQYLQESAKPCGVLTRNTKDVAMLTLQRAGLLQFFPIDCILGRDSGAAKPSPEGIEKLLSRWGGKPEETVMIGDDLNDILAGNAAGCSSVYIQREHLLSNPSAADILCVDLRSLITTVPIGVKGNIDAFVIGD